MSTKKDKAPPGIADSNTFQNHIGHCFPDSNSVKNKTEDEGLHSSYYLFDDDDDFTTLGRNISEYVSQKKSGSVSNQKRGNTTRGPKSA